MALLAVCSLSMHLAFSQIWELPFVMLRPPYRYWQLFHFQVGIDLTDPPRKSK